MHAVTIKIYAPVLCNVKGLVFINILDFLD